jgi:CheY-like chemotaxis protein
MSSITDSLSFLLVDDEEVFTEILSECVRDEYQASVKESNNGKDALEHCSSEHFDVIITDYYMPMMNGIEFIQRLRTSEGPNQSTPVIFFTAYNPKVSSSELIWDNVFFLQKPLSTNQLNFTIKCCLQLKSEAQIKNCL